jgi:phosphogluconate dehydratase
VMLDGALGKVRNGDMIELDAEAGTLNALVDAAEWAKRSVQKPTQAQDGMGRELFAGLRDRALAAEQGALTFSPAALSELITS